jgi:hypothetical protein
MPRRCYHNVVRSDEILARPEGFGSSVQTRNIEGVPEQVMALAVTAAGTNDEWADRRRVVDALNRLRRKTLGRGYTSLGGSRIREASK